MQSHALTGAGNLGADMTKKRLDFPERRALRRGAVLASIAHAVATLRYPELSHERSWDDDNYCVQDSSGSRGVVSFDGANCVGAFFLESSDPSRYQIKTDYDVDGYFAGMPKSLHHLAYDIALQYMLDDYAGSSTAIITAVFWCDRNHERVVAAEPWSAVFENGAQLIQNELLAPQEALKSWQSEYELSATEIEIVQSVFARRMATPTGWIRLDRREIETLLQIAATSDALESGRESFGEIRIRL